MKTLHVAGGSRIDGSIRLGGNKNAALPMLVAAILYFTERKVGKALGTRAIFTERENGKMVLKRGFEIPQGARVLVVEDVVTTGGSVREVMETVREHGGVIAGVGLLVDRSGGRADFGVRTEALVHLTVETYTAQDCPLCKEGKPFTKRGRTGK